ncbi:FMRFamide receptor [Trichinella nelsoni]|uniref:FMRFamide receptor n=1 Tax=Trichinella nelsoni TaxID=6336 RepID=A0A0V0S8M6_9BILA|nr:FMRFamide receptor [Trichinella nelsoni]
MCAETRRMSAIKLFQQLHLISLSAVIESLSINIGCLRLPTMVAWIIDNETKGYAERTDRAAEDAAWVSSGLIAFTNSYGFIHAYLSPIICCIGILANIATIVVLTRPAMRTSVNVILAAMAACHATTMLTYLIFTLRTNLTNKCYFPVYDTYFWLVFVVMHADLSVTLHSVSLWLTVDLAIVRYLVLRRPQAATVANAPRTGIWIMLVTVVAVCACCFLNFLRNSIGARPAPESLCPPAAVAHLANQTVYEIKPPSWYTAEMEAINLWTVGIVLKVLPCILLSIFIALLIHILIDTRRRQIRLSKKANIATGDRTTALLLLIVFVFWLTQIPQGIMTIANAFDQAIFDIYLALGDFWDLLSLVNSCVSFPAYCIMSQMFRHEFMTVFGLKRCFKTNSQLSSRGILLPDKNFKYIRENSQSLLRDQNGKSEML